MKQKQIQPRDEVSVIFRRNKGKEGRSRTFQTESQRSLSHDKIIIIIPRLLSSNDLFSLRRELGGWHGWGKEEKRLRERQGERRGRIDGRQKKLGCFFCFVLQRPF